MKETTPTANPPQEESTGTARHPLLAVVVLGFSSLCAALTQSLVIPIQPELPALLDTSGSNAAWVVTATLLGGAVAMPVAGRLADIKGRKPVLVVSALVLLLGSLVAAVSSEFILVVIGRILQGLAMGYIPVAISFARELSAPKMRNAAVAGISATLGVGGALGLPLAAWISQEYNWHALFWLTAGLGVIVTALSATALPHRAIQHPATFDALGALGLAAGIVGVLVGVSKGNDWGWLSVGTLGAIIGGLLVLVLWGVYELRHDEPLVDLRSTARRPVLLTNIAAVLMGFGMMAQSIVIPQLLQMPTSTGYGLGQGVLEAGLWMAPAGLMMLLFSPISAALMTRFGGRTTLALGAFVMAAGYGFAFILTDAPWQLMLASCIACAGIGIGYAAMPMLVMDNLPAAEAGSGVGVNALMRSIGTTSAAAVMAIILTSNSVTLNSGTTPVPTQDAFSLCFLIGALAAVAAGAVTLTIRRRPLLEETIQEPERVLEPAAS